MLSQPPSTMHDRGRECACHNRGRQQLLASVFAATAPCGPFLRRYSWRRVKVAPERENSRVRKLRSAQPRPRTIDALLMHVPRAHAQSFLARLTSRPTSGLGSITRQAVTSLTAEVWSLALALRMDRRACGLPRDT